MTKEEKESLQTQYIKDFEKHFIKQKLDINNQEEIEYVKDIITKVFRLEIEELGYKIKGEEQEGETPFEFEFVNELEDNLAGRHCKSDGSRPNKIEIAMSHIYESLCSDDVTIRQNGCFS